MPRAKEKHPHLKFLASLEQDILSQVATLRAFGKPEVTGALFEQRVRQTLNDLLPAHLRAVPGIVVHRSGEPTSHFDCLIVDRSFPYLGTLGENKFVMASSLVGAMELTVRLDKRKLKLVTGKAREIENLNRSFPERSNGECICFATLATDSYASREDFSDALDTWISGDVHLMRHQGSSYHYWLESSPGCVRVCERETGTLLSDLLLMLCQDMTGILERRRGKASEVSDLMNDTIRWGTIGLKTKPQRKVGKREEA